MIVGTCTGIGTIRGRGLFGEGGEGRGGVLGMGFEGMEGG
jgi:hypothetical protein